MTLTSENTLQEQRLFEASAVESMRWMVVEPEVGSAREVARDDAGAGALGSVGGGRPVGDGAGAARAASGARQRVQVIVVSIEVSEVCVEPFARRRLRLGGHAAVPLPHGVRRIARGLELGGDRGHINRDAVPRDRQREVVHVDVLREPPRHQAAPRWRAELVGIETVQLDAGLDELIEVGGDHFLRRPRGRAVAVVGDVAPAAARRAQSGRPRGSKKMQRARVRIGKAAMERTGCR